ncbi:hydroxymethylglutaryl-CoA reductase, degradative [Brevibacillus centrosporus]|uniref:3-hydroxy-3-methylglutaryl coenzyme A reductase n=1 Tax=Brevibacillus centrosporus TaxID=54910 RepID=A0A1I3KXU7_9BACL|nr:hydroxymethylglutaryl-CoA reductase, degradative [Brevibacillus centrosporus]MEC2129826.1 hydroxymethylglutaryl-CoA reductase, degradative [Brevibacillus centrosporus]MED4907123.1 hydroxymethylglutaryl-CoA reductase, degradative [Brevibacillus centrosporus]RNB71772.1 hydroxymethylglutaryl-CoA reductase, degradative [Brevibacillus centrosporus]SFI77230.1 3-hydroxy-3-methylglutaryl-coenzyme A reductase [Brevibacillus centrosporus]GED31995.1 3-hydroxy-3-methylglutaryl-CoA reductase [Brevibacil
MTTSRVSGFYKLSPEERLEKVAQARNLSEEDKQILSGAAPFPLRTANAMIENVVGVMSIPLGIATNFKINGVDRFIPMATEEPSVVAAASNAARTSYDLGGFHTSLSGSIMRGQIQVVDITDPYGAMARIYENKKEILDRCNAKDPTLVSLGGGAIDVEVHVIERAKQPMVVLHLLVDTRDAMGANAVNTMAEAVAPYIEEITSGRVVLRIISNLADRRLVRARAVFSTEELGGREVVDNIIRAYEFAECDPYRATTHNKGIMNGISAVVLATGNDTRAVEAGAHAFASVTGRYRSLTRWELNREGNLVGTIELPMAVGIVGGATKSHPTARLGLKVMDITNAEDLAGAIAAVGLAQNLAAMRALAAEGIQKGHMALHARNLAMMAGAQDDQIDQIVKQAIQEKDVRYDRILELTKQLQEGAVHGN